MNHENMWNILKAGIMEKTDNKELDARTHEAYLRVLTDMTRIETEEYAKSRKASAERGTEYTVKQDIVGNVDVKATDMKKVAREIFEQITGHKVIDSLEKLEREMQKIRGKAPFSIQEPIVVDDKVDIPKYIQDEARIRGIRLAGFGVDVISSDKMPKGIFYQNMSGEIGFGGFE